MAGLFLRFRAPSTAFGGVGRVNQAIDEILRRHFPIVDELGQADLQVCTGDWLAPPEPARLFIDHGSFADGEFWLCYAPRLRTADTILVSSRVCVQVAERILDAPRPRLDLVPYFADTDRFVPATDRGRLRRELQRIGLPADEPLLLTVSAYSRRKNLHLSLLVLREVAAHRPDARLVLVGRPQPSQEPYAAELRELATRLGLLERVHFLPMMDHEDLARLMAAADLLLHLTTCRLENFGLVIAEALAAGLPVVAADWGGLRDLVTSGETGYIAPTHLTRNGPRVDWRSAADAAIELLADDTRRQRIARRAAEIARTSFTLDVFERRLTAAVARALDQPRAASESVRFTADGRRLIAAAAQVNLMRAGSRSQGEDFLMLLGLDEGEHARFLLEPAATSASAPRVSDESVLYAAVAFALEPDGCVRITEAGWIGEAGFDSIDSRLMISADGERSLADLSLGSVARDETRARAQRLVDLGALCPRSRLAVPTLGRGT